MTIDFAALVSRAAAAHAASAPLVKVTRSAEGRMVRATVASAPVAVAPAPVKIVAPVVTLDTALAFDAALRAAGKRPNANGVLVPSGTKREDEIEAIRAFVGYSAGAPHGAQLDSARMQANFTIRSARGQVAPAAAKVAPTVRGYVAGVNDAAKRAERDAAARRRMIVALVLDLRGVTTREGFHAALVAGGRDDAHLAQFLASDAEAVEAARALAADLTREHGIAE